MDDRVKCKIKNYKPFRRKQRRKSLWPGVRQKDLKTRHQNEKKTDKLNSIKIKKTCAMWRPLLKNEKTTSYRLGQNVCKSQNQQKDLYLEYINTLKTQEWEHRKPKFKNGQKTGKY